MMANSRFRCIGCGGELSIDEIAFTCPECGDLFEVALDTDALTQTSASEWKQTFAQRTPYSQAPDSSGVWAKREWVAPHITHEDIVTFGEGNSPLTTDAQLANWFGCREAYIKQCGLSHSGSFKDLGMTVLVSHVRYLLRRGASIPAVICASTGDTSAALAAYAARANIPAIVLLPRGKISTAQLIQPIATNATVLGLDTDFDGCMTIVKRLAQERGLYLANSMNSLRLEGQKTVAIECCQQLGWSAPDWFVIPGGNLGNVSALAKGLDLMLTLGVIEKRPRICVAQSANASPLYNAYRRNFDTLESVAAQKTLASAIQIGNPVSYAKAVAALKAYNGVVEIATEAELADASAVADAGGQFTCPHTGVALAAAKKLSERGDIAADDSVVIVSTANGLKFTDFKVGYHEGTLDIAGAHARQPINIRADFDTVATHIQSIIDKA